jgi:hypothetical protein
LYSGGNDGPAEKCLIQWISAAGQSDEDTRTNTGNKKKVELLRSSVWCRTKLPHRIVSKGLEEE